MSDAIPHFSAPLDLPRGPRWPNRFALAPLTNMQSNPDGTLSTDELRWLTARAEGGFGLTMTCAAFVAPAGQVWPGQLGISSDDHVAGLQTLTRAIRAAGSVSSVQLHHGGRRANPDLTGQTNVAPWADEGRQIRTLSTSEVKTVVGDFVAASVRAERAGFDGVQVHGAHGYLLAQFLDGRHNHRADEYGGSIESRSRVLLDVLDGIRASTGPEFQVGIRLSPEGFGITLAEGLRVAELVMDSNLVDYLDVSLWDVYTHPRGASTGDLVIDRFAALPRGKTRLGVAGKILGVADVSWCLGRGVDFVDLGTAAILHHDFPRQAAADAGFASAVQPVTREHLRREAVGPAFIEYLASNWDDLVA